jgi:hypothetical protein
VEVLDGDELRALVAKLEEAPPPLPAKGEIKPAESDVVRERRLF